MCRCVLLLHAASPAGGAQLQGISDRVRPWLWSRHCVLLAWSHLPVVSSGECLTGSQPQTCKPALKAAMAWLGPIENDDATTALS